MSRPTDPPAGWRFPRGREDGRQPRERESVGDQRSSAETFYEVAKQSPNGARAAGEHVRNRIRYAQLHFRARSRLAPQAQFRADLLGALTHVPQPPMPCRSGLQVLRVDARTVVADAHAQLASAVGDLRFDVTG